METATEHPSTVEGLETEAVVTWLKSQPLETKLAHSILANLQIGDMNCEELVADIERDYHESIVAAGRDPNTPPEVREMIGFYLCSKMWRERIR